MSEFERAKRTVGDRSIIMTSWYDDSKQIWRASAPAYAHLGTLLDKARGEWASRNAALDCLSGLLASHFEKSTR